MWRGYDVAYIDAVMQMPAAPAQPAVAQAKMLMPSLPAVAQAKMLMPSLVPRPGEAGRGRPFAFIGDVKLSDLKGLLTKEGYRTADLGGHDRRGRPFAFIGDVKLSDLKGLLTKEGYRTELKGGMLVVNGQVIIRKSGARMVFEGTICNEYAAVRNILLSQYHTL
ncbi:cleavage and polyadenylation factor 2 C-terminal-domain-containing protein [Baffinella frigidus]|nr:cleavage and polyadenylation factor 2 C-terminal-domain-containing protein [Cryptophyta sp. CCMP2293]